MAKKTKQGVDLEKIEAEVDRELEKKTRIVSEEALATLTREQRELLEAGGTDEQAEEAGVHVTQIHKWRRALGMPHMNNRAFRQHLALDLFGTPTSQVQEVKAPPGGWTPPHYVIREPLDYSSFCRMVWLMIHLVGLEPGEVAASVGTRVSDVEVALQAYANYLEDVGITCRKCGVRTDRRYGPFCSAVCRGS